MENSQSKDKLSTNTPSPNSDITSNISLILTPAPDIINPTDNEDFQVPEENLKAGIGDDKTAGAGAPGNSHSEGKSLITPSSSNKSKTDNGSNTAETIKPTVITPANSKNTSTAAIKDTSKQGIIGTGNSTTNTDNKTINDKSLKGNNKSSPQEINANNSVSKSSNMTSNKTGQQGSSAFPWLDQISKILGVK